MLRVGGMVALCLMLLALPAQAQKQADWVLLGETTVGFGVDRDVINIGRNEDWFRNRSFRQLHLAAERNDVHMVSIRVVYLNGFSEEIRIDKQIRAGRQLPVDLRGDRSYLQRVELIYRSRPSFRGQAVVQVYGEPARPQRPAPETSWLLLGETTVGFGVDRDVINIGQSEEWFRNRAFRQLHFAAERNDVHLLAVRLVYFNGFAEDVRIDRLVRAGGQIPVDLRGDRSFLRRIEMTYRARPSFRGQAVVKVYGEPARRGGADAGPNLELLGKKGVGFLRDRDVIQVGRREGAFRQLVLKVLDNDIEIVELTVVYGNGEKDRIPVKRTIRRNQQSEPLDLKGQRRAIDRIELVYRSKPSLRGEATLEIYGVQ
ncbi:MAG: hypothetical protein KJZ80_00370 [Hyphomicrobiaceae bacterium]|nr:hypothetical protein [Hyphomicrobiaceae bacterium]